MISILMPFRNAEPWIGETIASILSQTYTDWEIIAINDHSNDESERVLQSFHDERIHIFQNTGKGIIAALQTALKEAKGSYITRMDADDLMPENRLKLFAEAIADSPAKTVVTGRVRYFAMGSVSEGYLKYQDWLNERCENQDHFKHIYRECVVASPNWICRTEDIINHRLFEKLEYPEDYDLVFEWYKHDFRIKCLNEETLLWREHPLRTSRNSEHYQQASFFELKLRRFIEIDYKAGDRILVLGRGQKQKFCEVIFNSHGIDLEGITDKDQFEVNQLQSYQFDKLLIAFQPDNSTKPFESDLSQIGYYIGENAWYL